MSLKKVAVRFASFAMTIACQAINLPDHPGLFLDWGHEVKILGRIRKLEDIKSDIVSREAEDEPGHVRQET